MGGSRNVKRKKRFDKCDKRFEKILGRAKNLDWISKGIPKVRLCQVFWILLTYI